MTGATATTNQRRTTIRLTGRTSPRVFRFSWLTLLLAIAVPAAACAGVSKPQGWAGPTLANDTLYASVEPGKIAALDPRDLTVKWVFPADTDEGNRLDLEGVYGAPVVADGVVYFGAYDGNVYALDAEAGTPLWRFETAEPIIASFSFMDGTLYAGSTDGLLYAIDTTACTNSCPPAAVSTFDTTSSIWASPLLVEDVIYVPAMSGRLYALNAGSLDEVEGFFFETDAGLTMEPTLASEDALLVGGIDKKLFALDPRTGDQRWNEPFKGENWFWGKPVVDGATVYIADLDGNVHAVGLSDGQRQWDRAFKTDAAVRAAPVLAGDSVVVVDRHGNAYGLHPDDGGLNWGPTALDKTVLSDPFLLERSPARSSTAEPSPVPTGASPSPTVAASASGEDVELLIVAQGGDVCRIDPADGSPADAVLCTEVRL